MPFGQGHLFQTADDWHIDVFRKRLDVSRAPDPNTMHRVLSRGLEIARKVERACQGVVGPNLYHRVILPLRQRVNSFGDLHCSRHLVSEKCIAPLTYECQVKEERTTKRVTQGLG